MMLKPTGASDEGTSGGRAQEGLTPLSLANQTEILCGASMGRGNESLFAGY